jgi:hypothetical protein
MTAASGEVPSGRNESHTIGQLVDLSRIGPHNREVSPTKDLGRLLILVGLLTLLLVTVIAAFLAANGPNWAKVKSLLDLLLPAETALLGVAVTFYMTD